MSVKKTDDYCFEDIWVLVKLGDINKRDRKFKRLLEFVKAVRSRAPRPMILALNVLKEIGEE